VAAAAGYDPVSSQPARLYPTATAAAGYGPAVSDILEKFEDVLNPSQRLPDTSHGVLQHRRTSGTPPSPTRLYPSAAAAAGYGPASPPLARLYPYTAAVAGYGPFFLHRRQGCTTRGRRRQVQSSSPRHPGGVRGSSQPLPAASRHLPRRPAAPARHTGGVRGRSQPLPAASRHLSRRPASPADLEAAHLIAVSAAWTLRSSPPPKPSSPPWREAEMFADPRAPGPPHSASCARRTHLAPLRRLSPPQRRHHPGQLSPALPFYALHRPQTADLRPPQGSRALDVPPVHRPQLCCRVYLRYSAYNWQGEHRRRHALPAAWPHRRRPGLLTAPGQRHHRHRPADVSLPAGG